MTKENETKEGGYVEGPKEILQLTPISHIKVANPNNVQHPYH